MAILNSSTVCDIPSLAQNATTTVVSNLTFYELNQIVAGAFAAFSFALTTILIFLHATHLSQPHEQLKQIKIIGLISLLSLFSWIIIRYPKEYAYLQLWIEYIEAIALAAFFLLMCDFVSPSERVQDGFFATLQIKEKKRLIGRSKNTTPQVQGLAWLRIRYIAIFQYLPVSLLVAIVGNILSGVNKYCDGDANVHFGYLWLSIISNISVTFAVLSVIEMYQALKTHLAHHKPLAKLVSFKIIIFLQFLQGIVWIVLKSTNHLTPTSTLTYSDLYYGIPSLLTCIELVPISLFFFYAYSYRPYVIDKSANAIREDGTYHPTTYQGGFLGYRAILGAMDPREIFGGMVFAFKLILGGEEEFTRRHEDVNLDQGGDADSSDSNLHRPDGMHVAPQQGPYT
ncbi:hypothetical protein MMC25_005110 [Agyrium rufum]|nr:hypothetical protein [Agyrium rufum]